MALLFDHVFDFVDGDGPEARLLETAGLTVGATQVHRGQGTGSRSVLFDRSFLELVHLHSRPEAEAGAIRLDRRADFATTGCCPYGIGLRGLLSADERARFEPYHPPYFPAGAVLWIHKATLKRPGLPLVFVSEPWPGFTIETMRPGGWPGVSRSRFVHRCGASGVVGVRVVLPDARGWPLDPVIPGVEVSAGAGFHLTVALADARISPLPLNAWTTVVPA